MRVIIFRRGDNRPKVDREGLDRLARRLNGPKVRVRRPGVEALMIPERAGQRSAFYRLPVVPSAILNNPAALACDGPDGEDVAPGQTWADLAGFVLTGDDLGRAGCADRSSANSVRLWIEQNLAPVVDTADVSVVLLAH